jgi:hypothetical protein
MLAHIDPNDFTEAAATEMDAKLLVRFFLKDCLDKTETEKEQRPIYREKEYVEIRVPGKRDAQACRPATHHDKQRFPRHYKAFKERTEAPTVGTPLTEWTQIGRGQCEQLSFLNIKTVEQLAGASDTHLSKIHGGYTLKQAASEWLVAADSARAVKENEALKARLAALEEQIAGMQPAAVPDEEMPPELPENSAEDAPKPRRHRRTTKKPVVDA